MNTPQMIINMIIGGSSLGLTSKKQRCAYARAIHHVVVYPTTNQPCYAEIPITFGPEDARGPYLPHQDALFIFASIQISKYSASSWMAEAL